MKIFNKIFSGVLMLLAVSQFSTVQADNSTKLPVYQNVIQDVSLGYEDTLLAGTIKLDNDLVMHIVDYKTRDDNVMNTWHKGDVVAVHGQLKDEMLLLSVKRIEGPNQDKVEPYAIFDVTTSDNANLKIVEINDGGKFVKLNDGSVWEFSWYNRFSTGKWKAGQHVIVGGQGKTNSYDFINLDAPISLNVFSATGSFIVH
ncbi:MAG: hypothetical protein H0W50_03595 [Parachlamydiaceae bacterium]|nr:hypothetical protein [Parachlamydiaceae bacterium]